jgi:hypothetical protein
MPPQRPSSNCTSDSLTYTQTKHQSDDRAESAKMHVDRAQCNAQLSEVSPRIAKSPCRNSDHALRISARTNRTPTNPTATSTKLQKPQKKSKKSRQACTAPQQPPTTSSILSGHCLFFTVSSLLFPLPCPLFAAQQDNNTVLWCS